jgi:hypothetical protein
VRGQDAAPGTLGPSMGTTISTRSGQDRHKGSRRTSEATTVVRSATAVPTMPEPRGMTGAVDRRHARPCHDAPSRSWATPTSR